MPVLLASCSVFLLHLSVIDQRLLNVAEVEDHLEEVTKVDEAHVEAKVFCMILGISSSLSKVSGSCGASDLFLNFSSVQTAAELQLQDEASWPCLPGLHMVEHPQPKSKCGQKEDVQAGLA